jgi:hypothetical protein
LTDTSKRGRSPVARPAREGDKFDEAVIEVTESREEPVVGKQKRIVEEIIVGKKARIELRRCAIRYVGRRWR